MCPPNSYVQILIPKDDGIRRQGFWEVLKPSGEPSLMGLVLIKEDLEKSLAPSGMCRYNNKSAIRETSPDHAGTLISEFQSLNL